ncbi:hypothetical protein QFZ30_000537 [Arthrobacter pascens]|uniref:hypothetical protein n=1 Tax=Arthrobacter pascens TaxID=1677 RepID=UPI002791BCF7|nr:hypothetical protein [Arthrobacter pascens]MDQ0677155.1 hypothetical protein [Arthrobacter pascens]
MGSITRAALVLAFSAALAGSTALPASADPTTATIQVTGGALAISVPTGANLGTRANTVGGGTISGALGQVQVNDARSAIAGSGWVASVISTAFIPSPPGTAIAASAVGYTAGTIAKVGTATYIANDPASLVGVVPAVTATGITGDNSATWNPTISVAVPGGAAAAVYSATITHSLL